MSKKESEKVLPVMAESFVLVFRLIAGMLLCSLVACASRPVVLPPTAEVTPVVVPELAFPPVAPADMRLDIQLNQHLTVTRDLSQHELDVVLAINAHEVKMAAVGMGLRLITLTYDGQVVKEQRHPFLPESVSGERILRDMVLTFWPLAPLQAQLPEGWQLQDEGGTRRLLWKNQPVIRIKYEGSPKWSGKVYFENLQHHYEIDIVSSVG